MIEVANLSKRYGNFLALDNISFSLAKGNILGLLGPNGAGKTTTMRILTGYLPASEGKVEIAGFDIFQQPLQAKQAIGYLPENTPLYLQMRVRDYLSFMARLRKVPKKGIKQRVDEVIEKCWLSGVANKIIARLSKGFRQRVGIAQAMVHNPKLLILDEPTIGLDPKQIIQVRQVIKELKEDHTVILSTHILPEVSATCDKVLILNQGKLIAQDTPGNLARRVRGASRIMLQAIGPQEEITKTLSALEGVEKVQASGEHNFQVETNSGSDLRGKIAQSIVQHGWELRELRSCDVSLEEVFLHLTTEEKEEVML